MEKQIKKEIVDKITLSKAIARRMCLTIAETIKIIDIFEDEIIKAIKDNKKVQLNGFLVFNPKNVEGSTLVSPLDKKEYIIKPKRTVEVRVGKCFKESIKNSYNVEGGSVNVENSKQARVDKPKKKNP